MIEVRRGTPADLVRIKLMPGYQRQARDQMLDAAKASYEQWRLFFNEHTRAAVETATGEVVCVAGILPDGLAWAFYGALMADPAVSLPVLRAIRAGCEDFLREKGFPPYTVADPVDTSPRLQRAAGFRQEGDRWVWRQR